MLYKDSVGLHYSFLDVECVQILLPRLPDSLYMYCTLTFVLVYFSKQCLNLQLLKSDTLPLRFFLKKEHS